MHQLLLAALGISKMSSQKFILTAIQSAIEQLIKSAEELCIRASIASFNCIEYQNDYENLLNNVDFDEDCDSNQYHLSDIADLVSHAESIAVDFPKQIQDVFNEIVQLILIKYLVDGDEYFLIRLSIKVHSMPDVADVIAAASSGMDGEDFNIRWNKTGSLDTFEASEELLGSIAIYESNRERLYKIASDISDKKISISISTRSTGADNGLMMNFSDRISFAFKMTKSADEKSSKSPLDLNIPEQDMPF